jgi:3-methylfumaryl-CoA hydratase
LSFPDLSTIEHSLAQRERVEEICAPQLVKRIALLLDRDPSQIAEGFALPPGWHACLFTPLLRQSALREDGHAQEETLIPRLDFPRRMLGGRRTTYHAPLKVGMRLERISRISAIVPKTGRSGDMAIVTTEHAIHAEGEATPRIVEAQDSVFRSATEPKQDRAIPKNAAVLGENVGRDSIAEPDFSEVITPDTRMLFRYSAITFNTHRIHYDLPYATEREGYPGLIVNGGLATLLLTEFLNRLAPGRISSVVARYRGAIICGQPVRLCATRATAGWRLRMESLTSKQLLEVNVE